MLDRIENSPIGRRLAKGVFWTIAGTVISRGLMLVASVFVARILGAVTFGEYGIVRNTVGMLGVFAGLGLSLTATKHVAEFRRTDPQRAGRVVGLSWFVAIVTGGLMSLGLLVFAPWLAEHTLNAPHLSTVLRIASLILLIESLNGAQTGALSGFEAFKIIARVNLLTGLASFPILVGATYYGGLKGAVWGLTISLSFNWLLNHLAVRKEARRHGVPLSFTHCLREWSILWRFSLPAFLAGTLAQPVYWACMTLLANQPNGYEELGVFSAANQWYATLLFLPAMLGRVAVPIVSDQIGQRNSEQSIRALALTLKLNLLSTAPLVIAGCLASPWIMPLYGQPFADGWPTMVALLLCVLAKAVISPVGVLVTSTGRMWLGFLTNGLWAVTIIAATLLLIDYGSFGVAIARLISFVLSAVCNGFVALWLVQLLRQEEATVLCDSKTC